MERPKIKDRDVLEYVKYLEDRLNKFSVQSANVDSYFALENYIRTVSQAVKSYEANITKMSDKDDKMTERAQKFTKELLQCNKDLKELEDMIAPEVLKEEKKEAGSIYEEMLRDGK